MCEIPSAVDTANVELYPERRVAEFGWSGPETKAGSRLEFCKLNMSARAMLAMQCERLSDET